jgi:hypothetical protein
MQWFNEKNWIKSMYEKYITYIKSYVYGSCNITKQEQTKKKKGMFNYKISSSLYVSGFFLLKKSFYAFIV